jgi:[protein-PII] uridylyltransferase
VPLRDEHRRLLRQRRQAAARLVNGDKAAAARIAVAPPAYVLVHDSSDVARHAGVLSRRPAPGEVRAVVTPGRRPGIWHLDVAARDQGGLLAACTGVLAAAGLEVVQAVVATWDDGAALEAFLVASPQAPDVTELHAALERSLALPVFTPPVEDAVVTFDDVAGGLYTACEVRAPDRPGLLHALAAAMAVAGADVHAASVKTVDGMARDRFDLSDRDGNRLTLARQEAVRRSIERGVAARAS